MNEELTTNLASEIADWHSKAITLATQTKDTAEAALNAAVTCGQYIEDAEGMTHGKLLAWLRDNVPSITPERAKAYLSLFHVHKERAEHALDHRQLLLLGIVEAKTSEAVPTNKSDDGKWVLWSSRLALQLDNMTTKRPLNDWMPEERDSVIRHLKPIVETFKRLGGVL